jgi:hypothetical protein
MGGTFRAVENQLQWARREVGQVRELIERFEEVEGSPFVVDTEPYAGRRRIVTVTYREQRTALPKDEIAHQIGIAIHALRTTLDYLIYELTIRTKYKGSEPPGIAPGHLLRATAFPIFISEDAFDGQKSRGATPMLEGLTRQQRTRIKHLQPFKKPQHPLWVLAELDNLSKHRRAYVFLRIDHIVLDRDMARRFAFSKTEGLHKGGRIKDGTRIAVLTQRYPWVPNNIDAEAQVNMALKRHVALLFEKGGPAGGEDVVLTLRRIQRQVSLVVNQFRSDMPVEAEGSELPLPQWHQTWHRLAWSIGPVEQTCR